MDYIDRAFARLIRKAGWLIWLIAIPIGGGIAAFFGWALAYFIIDPVFRIESHWIHYFAWGAWFLILPYRLIPKPKELKKQDF